jgi:hypothetical protein
MLGRLHVQPSLHQIFEGLSWLKTGFSFALQRLQQQIQLKGSYLQF